MHTTWCICLDFLFILPLTITHCQPSTRHFCSSYPVVCKPLLLALFSTKLATNINITIRMITALWQGCCVMLLYCVFICMFYACSYCASYSQILNCVCVRVRGFFSFFFIVSMDILSEINFMMNACYFTFHKTRYYLVFINSFVFMQIIMKWLLISSKRQAVNIQLYKKTSMPQGHNHVKKSIASMSYDVLYNTHH